MKIIKKQRFKYLLVEEIQNQNKSYKLLYSNQSNFNFHYIHMTELPVDPNHPQLNQPPYHNQQTFNHSSEFIPNSAESTPSPISLTKSSKLGLCFVVFFACLIFATIFILLFYEQKAPPDDELTGQTIIDEPYQVGDQVTQTYDIVLLNTTKAFCLNGSPGSYYESRTGDPSRILLMFQSGGWCYGEDELSTLRDCLGRAKQWIGGSNFRPTSFTHEGSILSKHPNNYFRNWKKIYLSYCNGTGHQGRRKDPVVVDGQTIYFRGHDIKIETFQQLQRRFGIFSKARRVVVSGWSAGALAIFGWANYIYDRVQNGKVFVIPDAGIFYDAEDKNTGRHLYKQRMANMMKIANSEIEPPTPECLEQHPNERVNCMFAQYLYKHLKPRIFVVQSLTDTFSLAHILEVNCLNVSSCSQEQKRIIEQNIVNLINLLKNITSDQKNGAYATSCPLHEILMPSRFTDEGFTIPLNSTYTASRAIEQWFRYPKMDNLHVDLDSWPNNNAGCT